MADGSLIFDTSLDASGIKNGLSNMTKIVATGMATIGATLAAGMAAAIKFGSEFESSMAKVSTMVDTNKVNMQELNDGVVKLSNSTGKSAVELSEAMYSALSAGVDVGNSLSFVEQSSKLATAGFTTTESAVDALTTVMNGYKMSADQATAVSDMMLQTQNKGKTTVDELAHSLAQVTPTAAAMSVGFDQVSAALATMTAQGVPTAQATTQLNSLFAELGKSGTQANKAFSEATKGTKYAGKSFQDLMKQGVPLNEILDLMGGYAGKNGKSLLDMFSSIEAGKAALTMSGESAQMFTDNLDAMRNSAGLTEEGYDKMMDTFDAKIGILKENAKNFGIVIYEGIQEPLKGIADEGIKAVEQLQKAFEKDGIEGMLKVGSQLVTNLLNGIASAMPEVIGMASQILNTVLSSINELAPSLSECGTNILWSLIMGIIDNLPILAETAINLISNFASSLGESLPNLIPVAIQGILTFASTIIANLDKIVDAGVKLLLGLVQGIVNSIPMLIEQVPKLINDFWQAIDSNLFTILGAGVEIIMKLIEGIITSIPTLIANAGEIVKAIISTIGHLNMLEIGRNLIAMLGKGIAGAGMSVLEAIKTIINNAVNAFKNTNWLSLGSDIIKGLVNGILGGINSVIKAIKKVCNSIFDGIKNFFSIFSPSHKMRDEIGKHLPSGIAVGYERAMPEATKDMIDTTDDGFQKLKASAKTIGGEVAYDSVMPLPNTSTLGRDDLIDYDRLANSMSKVNMSVEMDKQPVGRLVTETVDEEIGKETTRKGRYNA